MFSKYSVYVSCLLLLQERIIKRDLYTCVIPLIVHSCWYINSYPNFVASFWKPNSFEMEGWDERKENILHQPISGDANRRRILFLLRRFLPRTEKGTVSHQAVAKIVAKGFFGWIRRHNCNLAWPYISHSHKSKRCFQVNRSRTVWGTNTR